MQSGWALSISCSVYMYESPRLYLNYSNAFPFSKRKFSFSLFLHVLQLLSTDATQALSRDLKTWQGKKKSTWQQWSFDQILSSMSEGEDLFKLFSPTYHFSDPKLHTDSEWYIIAEQSISVEEEIFWNVIVSATTRSVPKIKIMSELT